MMQSPFAVDTRALSSTRPANQFLFGKKAIFVYLFVHFVCLFLGPNAGPDGLIPWTRFCKVGTPWVLHPDS